MMGWTSLVLTSSARRGPCASRAPATTCRIVVMRLKTCTCVGVEVCVCKGVGVCLCAVERVLGGGERREKPETSTRPDGQAVMAWFVSARPLYFSTAAGAG